MKYEHGYDDVEATEIFVYRKISNALARRTGYKSRAKKEVRLLCDLERRGMVQYVNDTGWTLTAASCLDLVSPRPVFVVRKTKRHPSGNTTRRLLESSCYTFKDDAYGKCRELVNRELGELRLDGTDFIFAENVSGMAFSISLEATEITYDVVLV